jgi:hypothetical protein
MGKERNQPPRFGGMSNEGFINKSSSKKAKMPARDGKRLIAPIG